MFGLFGKNKKIISDKELKAQETEKEKKEKQRKPNEMLKNMSVFLDNYTLLKNRVNVLIKICLILSASLFISVGLIISFLINRPSPVYFAVTPDLKLVEMTSLAEPYVNDNVVKSWLVRSINDTLAIDFRNYERTLLDARKFFNYEAHVSLIKSMQDNNIINYVKEKRLILTPIIQQSPIILGKKVIQGVHVWICELELALSYEGSKGVERTQPLVAKIVVQRTSTLDNPEGINIRQIVFEEKKR